MFAWLKRFFSPLIKAFWALLKAIFRAGTEVLMASLKNLAVEVVKEIAADHTLITNEDKRRKAFNRLKDKAIEEGLDAKDHLINLSIELALAAVKRGIE